ncbi:MAG: histidine kinase [Frankiaceae bacterium]
MAAEESPDLDVLALLTGLRSSKLSFYKQYRRTSASLDRSILALASVSKALTALEAGPASLVEGFLPAVLETMGAQWAALVADYTAFPHQQYVLMATEDGVLPADEIPVTVLPLTPEPPPADWHRPKDGSEIERYCAPLHWAEAGWGWLAVGLPRRRGTDDTDAALMVTLAHQVVAAVQASHLLAERERLRAVASAAYEDVSAHAQRLAGTNRALRQARSALARAREKEVVEAERERLARELHDSVAQRVLAIGMSLEWCRGVAEDERLQSRLGEAQELARGTVETIRNAIFELSAVDDLLRRPRPIDPRHCQPDVRRRARRFGTPGRVRAAATAAGGTNPAHRRPGGVVQCGVALQCHHGRGPRRVQPRGGDHHRDRQRQWHAGRAAPAPARSAAFPQRIPPRPVLRARPDP